MKTTKFTWFLPIALPILISSLILSGCTNKEPEQEQVTESQAKKIEIFTVGEDKTPLSFTKSGQIESGTKSFVMPQVQGLVTNINVKPGDKVKKNQTLVTLGESLSTNATDLNYQLALDGLENMYDLELKTDYSAQKDIEAVMVGYYTAYEGVKNAINSKDNTEELNEEQIDNLEDVLDELEDTLDDMEELPGYKDNPAYQETDALYEQTESQLEQLELGQEAQIDQLDFAIDMAKRQLQSSIIAAEGVQAKYSLQFIQLDSSILQAETGAELAKLQKDAQNIKAPTSGVVTSVQAEEGNLANPGQALLTIENLEDLKVKTYVSIDEASLIEEGTLTVISSSSISTTGTITTINPTLSQNGKIEIEIEISDKKNLFSGEIVEITFTPSTRALATLVPLNSIIIEDDKYYINTIDNNKIIKRKEVVVGKVIENYIEILDGLEYGDKIAVSTNIFLRDGDKIAYKVKR